jgi:hypothetical protein
MPAVIDTRRASVASAGLSLLHPHKTDASTGSAQPRQRMKVDRMKPRSLEFWL